MEEVLIYEWKDKAYEVKIYSSKNRDKTALIYPTAKVFGFKNESDPEGSNLVMGKKAEIGDLCYVNCRGGVNIGDYSHIHAGSKVIGGGGLVIKKYVAVTYDVMIITGTDRMEGVMTDAVDEPKARNQYIKPIIIEDHVYVGSKSIIMPGVKIGEGTVVQAFSYVGKGSILKPWTVYGGIPCIERGKREISSERWNALRKWENEQG
jgi:galactoside O-acetyltransferase